MTVFITEDGVVDVPFTPALEALYVVLASERRLFSQAELYERLWGFAPCGGGNAMACRVTLVRKMLAAYGIRGKIVTRNGGGYMLGEGV